MLLAMLFPPIVQQQNDQLVMKTLTITAIENCNCPHTVIVKIGGACECTSKSSFSQELV